MLMETKVLASLFALLCASNCLAADICKYIDEDGRTVYSTAPVKNGKKQVCFKSSPAPAPAVADEAPATRTERPVASEPKPKVDGATQSKRDNERREILKAELARERQLLDEAQKRFDEEEAIRYGDERNYQKVLDRLKPFQDAVNRHQRNVDSLQQELANLR